ILTGLLAPALLFLPSASLSFEKILKLTALVVGLVSGPGAAFFLSGLWLRGRGTERKAVPEALPAACRRGLAAGSDAPEMAALPPQSIQHPIQQSVTEATTGLLPQEVKQTNDLK